MASHVIVNGHSKASMVILPVLKQVAYSRNSSKPSQDLNALLEVLDHLVHVRESCHAQPDHVRLQQILTTQQMRLQSHKL